MDQPIKEVIADRGFDTKKVADALEQAAITHGICPKDPAVLRRRLRDPAFRQGQRRRASTEARIGILKNNGRGRPSRAKGFTHHWIAVGWEVLAHNLWWIARKVRQQRKENPLAALKKPTPKHRPMINPAKGKLSGARLYRWR